MGHLPDIHTPLSTSDGYHSRLFLSGRPEGQPKPQMLLDEEERAIDLVLLVDQLAQLPPLATNDIENQYVDRIFDILSQHKGSPFIDKYLQTHLGMFMFRSAASPEKIISIPEKVGIEVDREGKIEKTGILSREGARVFELDHLIHVEPLAIKSAMERGQIREGEMLKAQHGAWQRAYTDFYQIPFTFDISRILEDEESRIKWYKRYAFLLT